jgi:glutamate transport system permease protein
MTASVMFDQPGPRARRRHRVWAGISMLTLGCLVALALYRLYEADQFAYSRWEPFITPRYLRALGEGVLVTLQMAFSAVILAVIFGLVGIGKLSDHAWVRWPVWAVVEFFRAVPVLLLMILIFFTFGIDRGSSGPYWSVVIALMLYNGAVLAEVFRAGILAVPTGQAEAAYAIGLRKHQVIRIVLLPQAVSIMLPAIISQCVVALKDTSLGYAVAAPGLAIVGRSIWQEFDSQIPTVIVLSVIYIAINLSLAGIATRLERRLSRERSSPAPATAAA